MQKAKDELHSLAIKRYELVRSVKSDERKVMLDDQKFYAGDQWPEEAKRMRGNNRPMQTINRLPAFVDQVIGDARQNKISIKVYAGEDGDVDIAQIYGGLVRSIESRSNADYAYDTALEHSAAFGFGAWRIKTQYLDDNSFEQEILIERIANPFNVYFDPNSTQPDYADAEYCFVVDNIPKDEFKERWPDAATTDFDGGSEWCGEDSMQICEYWYKSYTDSTLYLLTDGTVTEQTGIPPEYVSKTRTVKKCTIKMCILSGGEVLEKADWAGKYIPIVGVQGKEDLVDGKRTLRGIVRHAKDAQRMYNYWRTVDTEQKALAPKAPVLVSAAQINGLDEQWQDALSGHVPYLIYNPDPQAAMPQRLNAALIDNGFAQSAMIAVDEMKATTGIYGASLGEKTNETSGRAIMARQREGDVANFAFTDNLSRAVRYCARCIIDLIPKIYDTERVIEIMGQDGEKKLKTINEQKMTPDGQVVTQNDLTVGKYDLIVDVGASYTTKRIESLNMMMEMARSNPAIMQIAGDLIVKSMDWDGAQVIADRLKKTIPPHLIENEGDEKSQLPPEVEQMIQQGKQQIEQLQQENAQLQDEHEEKEADRRLKQYEIDVKAQIEIAKLAPDLTPEMLQRIEMLEQFSMSIIQNSMQVPPVEEYNEQQEQQFEQPEQMENEQEVQQMPMMQGQQMPEDVDFGGLLQGQDNQDIM